jgi:2-hydroxyglutarate dehydrogenase
VDPSRAAAFAPSIRRFFPALADADLRPAYSGVRPKLSGPGQPPADFALQGWRGRSAGGRAGESAGSHSVRGLVNLFGIESPGLTSSLAIADQVVRLLGA